MEDLTIQQLEDLIILAEEKLLTMRHGDDGYAEQAEIVGKLREMRLEKINQEA